jgi:hypothetical protein
MRYRKLQGQALIFVQPKDRDMSLEEFARQVFTDLAISKWQGFCGSQAPNSDGFAGCAVNIEVVIGREDEDSEYSFGVSLQPKIAIWLSTPVTLPSTGRIWVGVVSFRVRDFTRLRILKTDMFMPLNHSAAANSATALVLQIGDHWRGVAGRNRSAKAPVDSTEGIR